MSIYEPIDYSYIMLYIYVYISVLFPLTNRIQFTLSDVLQQLLLATPHLVTSPAGARIV
jgi:hypothetical protein